MTNSSFAFASKIDGAGAPKACFDIFAKYPDKVTEVKAGDVIEIDNVKITVMAVTTDTIVENLLNNASVIFKLECGETSVLFTGDMGKEQEAQLLETYKDNLDVLKADYVQMAHHGQNGATETFYQTVDPTYCLWPTPDWLWDSTSYKTRETRSWIEKLDVKVNYKAFEGVYAIKIG